MDISVIVATYDRPAALTRCLSSLLVQQTARSFEIIVVDNHPQSGLTSALAQRFSTVRWLQEPVAGLSRARNCGIAAAAGAVLVTTDDDVIAPPEWLECLTVPLFHGPASVVATTGSWVPWKVETEAEVLFEAYGGMWHGKQPAVFNSTWLASPRLRFPPLWRIGTAANAAFRASLFQQRTVGLFETRLGTGTPTGAWEDLDLFYRILRAGYQISFRPEAYLRHAHRDELTALFQQLCSYRRGETAFLTLVLLRHRDWRVLSQIFLWIPRWRLALLVGEFWLRLRGRQRYPFRLLWAESLAYLAGPWSLWRAHQLNRQIERTGTATS